MAEENIVIPRDRYNRMLEQLKSIKDSKVIQSPNSTESVEPTTSVTTHYDKTNTTQRSRDDITHKETGHPPGLKHNDIDAFITKFTKDKKNKNHTSTRNKRSKKPSKQDDRKSKLKANWIRVFN